MGLEFFNVGQSRSEWRGLKDGYIMEYNNIGRLDWEITFQGFFVTGVWKV